MDWKTHEAMGRPSRDAVSFTEVCISLIMESVRLLIYCINDPKSIFFWTVFPC